MYVPIPNIDWYFLKSIYPDTLSIAPTTWTTADSGGEISIDGISGRWNTNEFRSLNPKKLICFAAIFSHIGTGQERLFSAINTGTAEIVRIWINSDQSENPSAGKINFQMRTQGAFMFNKSFNVGSDVLNSGKDLNLVIFMDGTESNFPVKIFIDGIEVSQSGSYVDGPNNTSYFRYMDYSYYLHCDNNRGILSSAMNGKTKLFGFGYGKSTSPDFYRNLSSNLRLNLFNYVYPIFYTDEVAGVPVLSAPSISSITKDTAKVGCTLTF